MKVRIVKVFLAGVASLMAITVLLILTIDFGRFKETIESAVSEVAGREFFIDGPLRLTVGRTIQIDAEEIRLAAPDWSHEPELVTVGVFSVEIDAWSLVSGPVIVNTVSASGVRVFLEENEDQAANWVFLTGNDEGSPANQAPAQQSLPVVVNKTRISDLQVRYTEPNAEEPFTVTIQEITEDVDGSGFLTLSLSGDLNGTPMSMNLRAGHIDDLIKYENAKIRFSANLGEIEIDGDAEISDLFELTRPEVRLNLKGPDVGYLAKVFELQLVTSGPLNLEVSVVPSAELMRANVSGHFGEFEVDGTALFVNLQELDQFEAEFSASGPNVASVTNLMGIAGFPENQFTVAGSMRRSGEVLSIDSIRIQVGQTTLDASGHLANFPHLDSANASLTVTVPDIAIYKEVLGLHKEMNGAFVLESSLEALSPTNTSLDLTASIDGVALALSGSLTGDDNLVGSKINARLWGDNLAAFATLLDPAIPTELPYELSFDLEVAAEGYDFADGQLILGQDQINFAGRVGVEPLIADTRLRLALVVPDLDRSLTDFAYSVDGLPSGRLEATAEISIEKNNLQAKGVTVKFAQIEAEADLKLDSLSSFREAEVTLRVKGANLAGVLPPSEAVRGLNKRFSASAVARIDRREIELTDVSLAIDRTIVSARGSFSLQPMFDSGRMEVNASTPDLYAVVSEFTEVPIPGTAPFDLRIAGSWDGPTWRIDTLEAEVGDDKLSVNGTLEGPPGFDNTNLRLNLRIADVQKLGFLAGWELPHDRATLNFRLAGDNSVLRLSQLDGTLGDSDYSGSFSYESGDVPRVNVVFRSNSLDLTRYLPADEEKVTDPAASQVDPTDPASKIIPDTVLPLEALAGYDLDASLAIGELIMGPRNLRDVAFEGQVKDGAIDVGHFGLVTEDNGVLSGKMGLTPIESGAEFWIRTIGSNLELGLPAQSEEELAALPRYDINLALIATGKTVRDMAGSANGYLKLTGNEGKVKTGEIGLFTQDFMSELLSVVNPFARKDPYTNLRCTVVLVTVENGQVFGDPILVVQSDHLNIFADAKIDLKTEVLDADFNTVPQKGLGIGLSDLVNPYVKVGGTLAAPYIAVDTESALIEGGAAVATAGISILAKSLKGRFFSPKDACGDAVSKAEDEFHTLEEKYGDPEDATY